jgi:hypothetical protein
MKPWISAAAGAGFIGQAIARRVDADKHERLCKPNHLADGVNQHESHQRCCRALAHRYRFTERCLVPSRSS